MDNLNLPAYKNRSIQWARNLFLNKNSTVILDTETTGLGNKDVIIQISIINLDGNTLFNSLIKPSKKKRIPTEASMIHGIKMKDLINAPTFAEVVEEIYEILKNKTVIIYNEEFDVRLIEQSCETDQVRILRFKSDCAMRYYSEFSSQWSEYHRDFRYQKLPGASHDSLGDCKAVLKLLHKMADSEIKMDSNGNPITLPKEKSDLETGIGCILKGLFIAIIISILFFWLVLSCN